jgi:hypothetical protein
MKSAYKLAALSIFAFVTAGCAMHPDAASDEVSSSPLAAYEASAAEPAETADVTSTSLDGCFTYWACESCTLPTPGNQNIFVEECPDGSVTVRHRRFCGEDCF